MLRTSDAFMVRVALAGAAVFSGLLISPFAAISFMLLLALFWRAYEVLFIGLAIDYMWAPPGHIPYMLIGAIVLVWICEPLRKEFFS